MPDKKKIYYLIVGIAIGVGVTFGLTNNDTQPNEEITSIISEISSVEPAYADEIDFEPVNKDINIQTKLLAGPDYNEIDIPSYTNQIDVPIHNNAPFFTEEEVNEVLNNGTSFEEYSPIESYGHRGVAVANIGADMMDPGERQDISDIKPSGWQQAEYSNIDGGYLYNRSHLIGHQLSGNPDPVNIITGTRALNMAMLTYENMVADYVKETGNHVLYRVTPVFDGDNALATGVIMEGWSVEDHAEGICYGVFIHNVQPGIWLDYETGYSMTEADAAYYSDLFEWVSMTYGEVDDPLEYEDEYIDSLSDEYYEEDYEDEYYEEEPAEEYDYIINTNSGKFHKPSCSSAARMKESNKEYFHGTRDELIDMGYDPCGNCDP